MTTPSIPTGTDFHILETVAANEERRSLMQSLRPGTVVNGTNDSRIACTVLIDGDTNDIPAFTLIGAVTPGMRVMTQEVRPEGIYVVGAVTGMMALAGAYGADVSYQKFFGTNTFLAGAGYAAPTVSTGGSAEFAFVKSYDSTRLACTFNTSSFVSAAAAIMEWALLIGGTDYKIGHFFFNTANEHHATGSSAHIRTTFNGDELILPAGAYTVQVRGKCTVNNVSVDANDILSIRLQEVM